MNAHTDTMPPELADLTLDASVDSGAGNADANLSDLDRALAHWARRHGADALVARAFALASWAITQGHACLALDAIPTTLMSAANQKKLPAALAASPLVADDRNTEDTRPLVLDDNRLYLQRYHAYECQLAKRLRQLMDTPPETVDIERLRPGHGLFDALPDGTTNWQAIAAFAALRHRFTVISGGPGTGKTYTIVRLLRVLIEAAGADNCQPPLIELAAPTGKAAARMMDSVRDGLNDMAKASDFDTAILEHAPQNARTLHRLLGLGGTSTRPRFHADNPLPADVVIIDEASMVDLPMMAKLADAIRHDARLILLGDRYQLASVESGSVLAEICANAGVNRFTADQQQAADDLIAEKTKPATTQLADHVVTLLTSRRFNAESTIGQLAEAVNAGDADRVFELIQSDNEEVSYHETQNYADATALMDSLAPRYAALIEATDPSAALAELSRHCTLTAVRNGPFGSNTINRGIAERLARDHDINPAAHWSHGRPIIITRNDYRTQLYNGDTGVCMRDGNGELRVYFPGDPEPRVFLPSALPAHDSVFAMTIHKSQGSEFDAVTLVLPEYDVPVLTRELLYTGLTRAKTQLALYAPGSILRVTVEREIERMSGLAGRLARSWIDARCNT